MTTEDGAKLWYVARDGKQTGPISEAEIRAIAAHGYFRATDLVWRPGFSEWRPALSVFPSIPQAEPPAPPAPPRPAAPSPASSPSSQSVEPVQDAHLAGDRGLASPTQGRQPAPAAGAAHQAGGGAAPLQLRPFQPAGQPVGQPAAVGAFARPDQPTTGRPSQPAPSHTHSGQPQAPVGATPGGAPSGGVSGQPLPYAYRPAQHGAGAASFPLNQPVARTSTAPEHEAAPVRAASRPRTNRMALVALAVTLMAIAGGVYVAAQPALEKSGVMEQVQRVISSITALLGHRDANLSEIESNLQGTAHWPVIKREFPDWYGERLREAAKLSAENKSADEIAKVLAERIVALRRQNAAQALSASAPRLMAVANAFLDNLKQLKQTSPQVCYTFISQGELTPAVLDKLKSSGSDPAPAIQLQVAAIFEAIAEGRKSPTVYEKPQKSDYDLLMAQLGKLGWTQDDIAVFANPRSLARAEPARVCQMVQDWFIAHISIENADTRQRLIGETLRPVVSG